MLTITHTTEYFYGDTVPLCHNVVRLRPRDTERQRCVREELTISPAPATRREGLDFYGNHVSWFSLQEPHEGLSITCTSDVEVLPSLIRPAEIYDTWEQARQRLSQAGDREAIDARQFTFASPQVKWSAAVADFARTSFLPGKTLFEAVTDVMGRIHSEFRFVPGSTAVGTPVDDVLKLRQGVCQDFAHLMLACVRSMGLAGRYVSGYVVTQPAPGMPRLAGADASHAWVSVWFPGGGWVDFDPTNNTLPADQHVTVAWARDYDDVAPVKGVIIGGHQHGLRVAVDVIPV